MKKIFITALLLVSCLLLAQKNFRREGDTVYAGRDADKYKVDIVYTDYYAQKVVAAVDSCLNSFQAPKAVKIITYALRKQPKNPQLLLKAGLMLLDMKNPDKALNLFEKSLKNNPEPLIAKAAIVFCYYGADYYKKYDKGIAVLNIAKQKFPQFSNKIEEMVLDLNKKKLNLNKN